MRVKVQNISSLILKLVICVFSIGIFTPVVMNKYPLAICIAGALFFFLTFPSWLGEIIRNQLFQQITILFFVEILYRMFGLSSAALGNYAIRFIAYISVWIGIFISTKMPKKEYASIVKFSIIVILLNLIDNVLIYQKYPELLGTGLFTNINYIDAYGLVNLGATSFCYMIMFTGIFLYCLLRIKKRTDYRFFLLGAFIFISLFVFIATGSGTIILSYVFSITLITIFGKKRNKKNEIIILVLSVFTVVFFIAFSTQIMEVVIAFIEPFIGEKAASRLNVIMHIMEGSYSSSDKAYLARIDFMIFDISNWLSSFETFVFGNGYHTYSGLSVYESLLTTGDGGHSGFIDLLPRYGLLGFFLVVGLIKNGYRFRFVVCDNSTMRYYSILFLTFLINNVFNAVMIGGVLFVLFAFFPLVLHNDAE